MAIDQDVYCTLVMSDSYLPGAAVLANSLRDAGTKKKLAVLVTLESLRASTITELKSLYDYVLPVDRIVNPNPANLYLMNRSDLLYAFTKIGLWRQTQFRKIVYIDADVVALRAPDELFDIESPFAAAPDVGWPDAFNTGVMALNPHMGDYWALHTLASSGDSFDGADQGLLNQYYEHKDWHQLSFKYNCTPSANYQYEPAYRYHKSSISMVHFIGSEKPWSNGRSTRSTPSVYKELLNRWWAVYDRHYRASDTSKSTVVPSWVKGESTLEPGNALGVPVKEDGESKSAVEDPKIDEKVELKRFEAPQMDWDATRAPPPSGARPEAANFGHQTYLFNEDTKLFQPPGAYPEPPKDMWYEVPKDKPQPKPVFPWEERSLPKPSRVFAEDAAPMQAGASPFTTSAASETDSDAPVTPTIQVTSHEALKELGAPNRNAWDEVSGIDQYVRELATFQKLRGKLQVISQNEWQARSPDTEQAPSSRERRESLILTDFPTAVERPSLPVTPAPIRRPSFWGEERNEQGQLPQAEGVPDQTEWNPSERLEELRRNSLIDPNTVKIPAKNVPKRDMPRTSTIAEQSESDEPHVHFRNSPQPPSADESTAASSSAVAKPTFGEVSFAPSGPVAAQEEILSPTEHGSRTFA